MNIFRYASLPLSIEGSDIDEIDTEKTRSFLRTEASSEPKNYRLAFLLTMSVVIAFIITVVYSVGSSKEDVEMPRLIQSTEETLGFKESYKNQELTIAKGNKFDDIDIEANNSDPLPSRRFSGSTAQEMCESGMAGCVQRFAKIRPLIVTSPRHHLMSCLIQKSMSTVMSGIFCYLFKEDEFVKEGRNILRELSDIGLCQDKNRFKNVKSMIDTLDVANISDWKFTMVTREPVDRFLSGYIDRCLRVGDGCFGCGSNMTCFLEAEYQRAEAFANAEELNKPKPHISMEDIHVFPQNWRCSMQDYYEHYEFIRYSSDPSGTLLSDLSRILRAQNVSEHSISYIASALQSGRTIHSTVKSSSRVFLEKRLRASPYLMELIVRLFYHDYKLLGYPLPDLKIADSQQFTDE